MIEELLLFLQVRKVGSEDLIKSLFIKTKNMRKIFIITSVFVTGLLAKAQILTNTVPSNTLYGSNVLIDGSTNYSMEAGESNNKHKGVIIPSVDLVNFEFDISLADGITFPTYFDGMIVYNRSTGTTLTTGNRSSTATAITPGYYYYYNPTGNSSSSVKPGVWKPFTAAPANVKVNVTNNTPTITNLQFNGKDVIMQKGTFTANGTSTSPTAYSSKIAMPTNGVVYRITIFKAGTGALYSNSVYSYANNGDIVTGSPSISVVYPAGDYDYTVEYYVTNP